MAKPSEKNAYLMLPVFKEQHSVKYETTHFSNQLSAQTELNSKTFMGNQVNSLWSTAHHAKWHLCWIIDSGCGLALKWRRTVTWTNIALELWNHTASLGHKELNPVSISVIKAKINQENHFEYNLYKILAISPILIGQWLNSLAPGRFEINFK